MVALDKQVNTPNFVPDYMARSITDIDFKLLAEQGVKYVAFDADSTLVPYRGIELSDKSKNFLLSQKSLFKKWCIASNRVTNDLDGIAEALDIDVIRAGFITRKPKKVFFRQVLKHFKAKPHEVAMIGDKLMADIWGGNRSGLVTVWVEHLGKDSLIDRVTKIRQTEKRVLKRYL